MIFRLSQKLNAKLNTGPLPECRLDENPFADWSAHAFAFARKKYILVSNTRSLYSIVLDAKGINHEGIFVDRALRTLESFAADVGQMDMFVRFIAPNGHSVRYAKALNRSVTGSMNELIYYATACFENGDVSPYDVAFELNEMLLSAISPSKADAYGTPREAMVKLAQSMKPG
jgi:hypothetical protein